MEGMVNKTHLQADRPGEYKGSSAEISGEGFAGMKFIAKATTRGEFDSWVASVKNSGKPLDLKGYTTLAKPSENTPVTLYAPVQNGLYNKIVMKFMAPSPASQNIGDRSDTHQMKHGMQM
jgi:cytochrome o ubiquinol oxidase subunit 2